MSPKIERGMKQVVLTEQHMKAAGVALKAMRKEGGIRLADQGPDVQLTCVLMFLYLAHINEGDPQEWVHYVGGNIAGLMKNPEFMSGVLNGVHAHVTEGRIIMPPAKLAQ